MFGYVRPLKGELKVKEFEQFKAAYCGLCNTLKRRYGFVGRYLLNYDFTFLAMLLSTAETSGKYEQKRCPSSPFKKKCAYCHNAFFDLCADFSVILTWWKLKDAAADEGLLHVVSAGIGMLVVGGCYRRAKKHAPEFDTFTRKKLSELNDIEQTTENSLDAAADKFALILSEAGRLGSRETERRANVQLLYQLGRIIYILDAVDDLEEDVHRRRYNPLIMRFNLHSGMLSDNDKEAVKITLTHASRTVCADFELLPKGIWSPVLENIVYLGIPYVTDMVLSGQWKIRKQQTNGEMK